MENQSITPPYLSCTRSVNARSRLNTTRPAVPVAGMKSSRSDEYSQHRWPPDIRLAVFGELRRIFVQKSAIWDTVLFALFSVSSDLSQFVLNVVSLVLQKAEFTKKLQRLQFDLVQKRTRTDDKSGYTPFATYPVLVRLEGS